MKLSDKLKYYFPITFAIIVVLLFTIIGTLLIIGITPFKKNINLGIGLIIFAVFAGFYTGICIGNFIVFLLRKCIPDEDSRLNEYNLS
jgi:hypothetical protein